MGQVLFLSKTGWNIYFILLCQYQLERHLHTIKKNSLCAKLYFVNTQFYKQKVWLSMACCCNNTGRYRNSCNCCGCGRKNNTCNDCVTRAVSGCPANSDCEWYPIEETCERTMRMCCDQNGCCGMYPQDCRNTFWPDFAHPRWLCCRDLYCARRQRKGC